MNRKRCAGAALSALLICAVLLSLSLGVCAADSIRQDYITWLRANHPEDKGYEKMTPDQVAVYEFGEYDGGTVVLIYGTDWQMTDDIVWHDIGGYSFYFGSGSLVPCFLLYHDGTFTPVKESWEVGLLSDADLEKLAEVYGARKPLGLYGDDDGAGDWAWASEMIYAARHAGIMTGFPGGVFCPAHFLTRAEAAAIACRAVNVKPAETGGSFSDVDETAWYAPYVNGAAAAGIVKGYPDGTFAPERPVSRAEFAAIVVRMMGYEPADSAGGFSDVDETAWYAPYVITAKAHGAVNGYPGGFFGPERQVKRSEACAMMYRVLLLL